MKGSLVTAEIISIIVLVSLLPAGLVSAEAIGPKSRYQTNTPSWRASNRRDTRESQGEGIEAANFQPYKWDYGYGLPQDGSQTSGPEDDDDQETSAVSGTGVLETGNAGNNTVMISDSTSASAASATPDDDEYPEETTSDTGSVLTPQSSASSGSTTSDVLPTLVSAPEEASLTTKNGTEDITGAISTLSSGSRTMNSFTSADVTASPFMNSTVIDGSTLFEEPTGNVSQPETVQPVTPTASSSDPRISTDTNSTPRSDATWSAQNTTDTLLSSTTSDASGVGTAEGAPTMVQTPLSGTSPTESSLSNVLNSTAWSSASVASVSETFTSLGHTSAPFPSSNSTIASETTDAESPASASNIAGTNATITTSEPLETSLNIATATGTLNPNSTVSDGSRIPFPTTNKTADSSSHTGGVGGPPFTAPGEKPESSTTNAFNLTASSPPPPSDKIPASSESRDSQTATLSNATATSNSRAESGAATIIPTSTPPFPASNSTLASATSSRTGAPLSPAVTISTSEASRPNQTASGTNTGSPPFPTIESPEPSTNATSLSSVDTGSVTIPTISQNNTFPGVPPVTDIPLPPVDSSMPANISSVPPDESGSLFQGPPESVEPTLNMTDTESAPSTADTTSAPFPVTNSTSLPPDTSVPIPTDAGGNLTIPGPTASSNPPENATDALDTASFSSLTESGDDATAAETTEPPFPITNSTSMPEASSFPRHTPPSNETSVSSDDSGSVFGSPFESTDSTSTNLIPAPTAANATLLPFPSANSSGIPKSTESPSSIAPSNATSVVTDETGSTFQGPPESTESADTEASLPAVNSTYAPIPTSNATSIPQATDSFLGTPPWVNTTEMGSTTPTFPINNTSEVEETGTPTISISSFSATSVEPLPSPAAPNTTLVEPSGAISLTQTITSRNVTESGGVGEPTDLPTMIPPDLNSTSVSPVSETPLFPNSTASAEETGDVSPTILPPKETGESVNGTTSVQDSQTSRDMRSSVQTSSASSMVSTMFPNATFTSQTEDVSPTAAETAVPSNATMSAPEASLPRDSSTSEETISASPTDSALVSNSTAAGDESGGITPTLIPPTATSLSESESGGAGSTTTVMTGPVSNVTVTASPSITTAPCITLTVTHGNVTEKITKTLTESLPDATRTGTASATSGENSSPIPDTDSQDAEDQTATSCDSTMEMLSSETTTCTSSWRWPNGISSANGTTDSVQITSKASTSDTSPDEPSHIHETASITSSGLSSSTSSASAKTASSEQALSLSGSSTSSVSSDHSPQEASTPPFPQSNITWISDPTTLITSTVSGGDGEVDAKGPFISPTTTASEPLPKTPEFPWGGEGPLHRHHNVSVLGEGSTTHQVRPRGYKDGLWSARWRKSVEKLRVLWKGEVDETETETETETESVDRTEDPGEMRQQQNMINLMGTESEKREV